MNKINIEYLNRKNSQVCFRTLLVIVCSVGLIYQTSQLIGQYMSGNTVIQMRIESLGEQNLPAFTVCFDQFISFWKLSKVDPEIGKLFQDYLHVIEGDQANKSKILYKIHNKAESIYLNSDILGSRTIPDLFDNITIPFDLLKSIDISDFRTRSIIKPNIRGIIRNGDKFFIDYYRLDDYYQIESISLGLNSMRKCFTLFSSLSKVWREYKINLDKIEIRIFDDLYSYPEQLGDVYFTVHSPNSLPDFIFGGNFQILKRSEGYTRLITYSQINLNVLDHRYDTNCFEYDHDHKFGNFNMRSDCITSCIQRRLKDIFKQNEWLLPSDRLLRKEMFLHDEQTRLPINKDYLVYLTQIKRSLEENITLSKIYCQDECRPDCTSVYYVTHLDKIKNVAINDLTPIIILKPNRQLPHINIQHIPEIVFIEFVCNLGGLIGMWLGLSFLAIYDVALGLFEKFEKFKSKEISRKLVNSRKPILYLNKW